MGGAGPDCGKPGQADTPNLAGLPRGPRDPYPVRLPRLPEFTHFKIFVLIFFFLKKNQTQLFKHFKHCI